jgi:hypothetical protein
MKKFVDLLREKGRVIFSNMAEASLHIYPGHETGLLSELKSLL